MVSVAAIALAALPLYWVISTYTAFRHNLKAAKSTGLPYIILPVYPLHWLWMVSGHIWLPLIKKTCPESWYKSWSKYVVMDWTWHELYAPLEELGTDTFITVTPIKNVLWVATAEVIHQITSRREAFPKPLRDYKVLDIYGQNVVTTEGAEWKMHRKATSPGFNEKNNALVFQETISQAQGMIRKWMDGNETISPTLNEIPTDTMRVALHIISAMGFGVRLLWPGDTYSKEDKDSGLVHVGDEPIAPHTMSFERALSTTLDEIFVIMLTPKWLLRILPWKRAERAWEAYQNWKMYMDELFDKKVEAEIAGEKSMGMDIMGALVKSATNDGRPKEKKSPGQLESNHGKIRLTDENIIGNSFVMLLAGHETTANTIHFCLMELAMNPSAQRHVQKDIRAIFGNSDPKTWNYEYSVNRLLGGMVGAVMNEQLRLMPPVTNIPKSVRPDQDQTISIEGEKFILPKGMYINFNVIGAHRNPKYWPSRGPSKVSDKQDDLDDFVPERWLREEAAHDIEEESEGEDFGGYTGKTSSDQLFRPPRGAFIPFSDGPRSCLGRRLAQVELIAALGVIFQKYSIELAVDEWASDEEVERMSVPERLAVYAKATKKAREVIRTASSMITLKLHFGETYIPARLVKKGEERFIRYME